MTLEVIKHTLTFTMVNGDLALVAPNSTH